MLSACRANRASAVEAEHDGSAAATSALKEVFRPEEFGRQAGRSARWDGLAAASGALRTSSGRKSGVSGGRSANEAAQRQRSVLITSGRVDRDSAAQRDGKTGPGQWFER